MIIKNPYKSAPDCNVNFVIKKAYFRVGDSFYGIPEAIELDIWNKENTKLFKTIVILIAKLSSNEIKKLCPFIYFNGADVKNKITEAIFRQLEDGLKSGAVEIGYYLDHTGATVFPDGHTLFLRGSELIGDNGRPYTLAPRIQNIQLVCCDEFQTSNFGALLLCSQLQVLLVLAFAILSSVRSVVLASGIDLQAVQYIIGRQGVGKTTLSTRIAGIYRQSDNGRPVGLVQAGSTSAALETMLTTYRDMPIIVDDLCLSAGKETERKRRELGAKLVREGSGHIPIVKKSGRTISEQYCAAGIIMTAEFALENMSDLTRCLIVPINEKMNLPKALSPELIGSMIRHYSAWFIAHEQREIERLICMQNQKVDSQLEPRMFTNYTCLAWAFQSMVLFMRDHGLSSDVAQRLLKHMDDALEVALWEHQSMITKLQDNNPVGNLPFCILEGFQNNAFDLTNNIEKLSKHGGIEWKGDLCLRPEELIRFIRLQPGYQEWTSNRITRVLKDLGALVIQEDTANTVHLEKSKKKKFVPRVYRIRIDILEEYAQQY